MRPPHRSTLPFRRRSAQWFAPRISPPAPTRRSRYRFPHGSGSDCGRAESAAMFASPPECRRCAQWPERSPSRSDSSRSARAFHAGARFSQRRWLPARCAPWRKRPPFGRCHHRPDASIDSLLAPDRHHHSPRLIALPEIMLLRFALHHIEKEPLQLRVSRPGAHHFHDVELEITSEAGPELAVTGQPQLVAALAEMQVAHRADKPHALIAARNLVVTGRT